MRTKKPLDKLLTVEIVYLVNLLSRPPDNHRFLRIGSIIELSTNLLKVAKTVFPSLFCVDICAPDKDVSVSSTQIIMQITIANIFLILSNFFSFLGYWSIKGAIISDDQFITQCKNELLKNDFLSIQQSKNDLQNIINF